ncbi:hypothetical protein JCM3766R1_006866 [Sporobolomyces carnicolor]
MTFPRSLTTRRRPLSNAQEGRLIRYLDPALLELSGNFESRHSPASQLPTLTSFLDAIVRLFAFVLAIPAATPSGGLRVAYLLQLTGYLSPAIEGYPLNDASLDRLFLLLDTFDRGWTAVLEGREWDSVTGRAKEEGEGERSFEAEYEVQSLRNTDFVRIKSIIQDLRQVLSSSLNVPELVPLAVNPFDQVLGVDVRTRFGPREGQDENTPELSTDGETTEDDSMSIDTTNSQANRGPSEQGDDSDDDSDAEFEPVDIVPQSRPIDRDFIDDEETSVSASLDPDDPPSTFEIHFNGPPPPTLTDGDISINPGQTPIVGQSRGFDPDEEYPPEDEDEVEASGERDGEWTRENRAVRDKVKRVFETTEATLRRLDEAYQSVS